MDTFSYLLYTPHDEPAVLTSVSPSETEAVQRFHRGLPGYAPTPLICLPALAARLKLGAVWVKDESGRFGLNSFKALGGSYAIARYLCEKLGIPVDEQAFTRLLTPEARQKLGQITFITATDGNHGRGVAWSARMLGHRSVVYLPKGSARERLENIRAQGAQAEITDMNYDDTVRMAARTAEENGWVLIQDTAWPGYEDVPTHVMQGYSTLARESIAQAPDRPTHLFLQAGVGSMAGAVAGYFAALYGTKRPVTVIVEPDKADCLYRTAQADDGTLHIVTGHMNSMMAGLCCGEPCTVSWDILRVCSDAYISCADAYSAQGMRLLGLPEGGDPAITSGESGAVTLGVLAAIMTEGRLEPLRRALGLDENARVLLLSTEGDTDRANYRRIVHGS